MAQNHRILSLLGEHISEDRGRLVLSDDAATALEQYLRSCSGSTLVDALHVLLEFAYFAATEKDSSTVSDRLIRTAKAFGPQLRELDPDLHRLVSDPKSNFERFGGTRSEPAVEPSANDVRAGTLAQSRLSDWDKQDV